MIIVFYFILGLSGLIIGFLNLNPQFGGNPNSDQKKIYSQYANYKNNEFINIEETIMMTGEMPMSEFFKNDSNKTPNKNIPFEYINIKFLNDIDQNSIKFSWLGHSAFILNIDNKIIMLDPMLTDYASPIPISSLKRYGPDPRKVLSLSSIDSIDIVIFSHDHYDHLDYESIKLLKNKVKKFYVPLGLGSHLTKWGINKNNIVEMNWNENSVYKEINIHCLPSRHFSGRGLFNRNSTLWASWAIISRYGKIYFSGDSGYGKHFKTIGNQHGPFDLVLIDSGQYNSAWKHSHMFPEEAVNAAIDLKAKYFMPIHWGAFVLSTHEWNEPIKESIKYANIYGQKIITPKIGQINSLNSFISHYDIWWIN